MLGKAIRFAIAAASIATLSDPLPATAASQSQPIPGWLQNHVGTRDGQIAPVVLDRARSLYQRKLREGAVANDCYFALDATRPHVLSNGTGRRFYVICEQQRKFRAISSGHGSGRKLRAVQFRNGRRCAKHFSNTEGSNLSAGGGYVTAAVRQSFKGYYRRSGTREAFVRPFLIFDGEGDISNTRLRDIGGHQAVFLRPKCRLLNPQSPHADDEGYVPFGTLVNYTGGRSNGCTTWSPTDASDVIALVEGNPTTLYVYPEARDIEAVARAAQNGKTLTSEGLYWNSACLNTIGAPRFWSKEHLQPIIDTWRNSLPKGPVRKLPICE